MRFWFSPRPIPTDTSIAVDKECSTCAETIRAGARKCVKCGSYQDWRRFTVGSAAAVSVGAAIVSVGAGIAPHFKDLFTPAYSSPELRLTGAAEGALGFTVRNRGSEPIYVYGAELDFGKGHRSIQRKLKMLQREITGTPILGGQTKQFTLLVEGGIGPYATSDSVCIIYLTYAGRNAELDLTSQRVSCPALGRLGELSG